mmetsp:Transcript_3375/g.7446  ORF Transcript_3375/g.7446 Transcript_3375/m.7446 type:complete len:219 (+) Transcript_3375:1312-1968(+)
MMERRKMIPHRRVRMKRWTVPLLPVVLGRRQLVNSCGRTAGRAYGLLITVSNTTLLIPSGGLMPFLRFLTERILPTMLTLILRRSFVCWKRRRNNFRLSTKLPTWNVWTTMIVWMRWRRQQSLRYATVSRLRAPTKRGQEEGIAPSCHVRFGAAQRIVTIPMPSWMPKRLKNVWKSTEWMCHRCWSVEGSVNVTTQGYDVAIRSVRLIKRPTILPMKR